MAFDLNSIVIVKLSIALIIVSTSQNLCILTASIGENSGNTSTTDDEVPELSKSKFASFKINESLHQDQVCPSITTEDLGRDTGLAALYPISIITVNLPKLHEAHRRNNDDFPCNFKVRGYGHVTNIGVRAIHYTTTPWNFYKSSNCDSFIKFRVPDPPEEKEPDDPYIICRIWKLSLGQKNPNLIHPILWHLSQKNLAISFPPRSNGTESRGESQPHSTYLQIVFTVSSGESCSIRVQQYLVDENNEGCNATYIPPRFRSCGTYRCSDNIHLMNQLGSWTYINWGTQSEFEPPRAPVLRSRMYENGYVRRRTYWFTALVRSSVVPILFFGMILLGYKFFCVLYPSYPVLAERRARIAQNHAVIQAFNDIPIDSTNLRECLSQGRVFSRSEELSDRSRTISDGVQRLESILPAHEDDLPPTYESLSPPTYSEATKV